MTARDAARADVAQDVDGTLAAVTTVVRARRIVMTVALAGAVVGLLSGLLRDRLYTARTSFLPKGAEEGPSGLALAASQLGVNLQGRSGEWWPAIYVDLLNSRGLLEPIVEDTVVVVEEGGRRATIGDLLKLPAGSPAYRRARGVIALRRVMGATEDKRLGAVKVSAATKWPSVSLHLVQRVVDGVHRFNIETRQTLAAAERKFVEERTDESERALRRAEDALQVFLQRNRQAGSPELQFDRDRLQRDVTIRMQMYSTLLQNQEQARLREVRNTPVITMIEAPLMPVIPESRGTVLRALLGLIAGALLAMLYILGVRQLAVAERATGTGWPALIAELREATPRLLRRWIGL